MSDELDEAIRKLETKHRFESFLMKIGASEEAAKLIASSPDQIKGFVWDGVSLVMRGSDLPASEDQQAIDHFVKGPFAALFVKPTEKANGDAPQMDEALVASAKAGNLTAKGKLARQLGSVEAVDKLLAGEGQQANGSDHANNPFSRAGWNVSKQGSVFKALGEKKTAELAAAVGVKPGAVTWNKNHPANR
jgi:hypothetical protein